MEKLTRLFRLSWVILWCFGIFIPAWNAFADPIIIDHRHTDINRVPRTAIEQAKNTLHIAYGHTSHGSQLVTGIRALANFADAGLFGTSFPAGTFAFNNGGTSGALDFEEGSGYNEGWLERDCGYYPDWVEETRAYLDDSSHADVNVIMWSWCTQVTGYTEQQMIDRYLDPMAQLERDYPNVIFVYMTGTVYGKGDTDNLNQRNQQIRDYCRANDKVLFDFADIESYDPDNNYYLDKSVDDALYYDSDNNGSRESNWASEYLAANPGSQLFQLVNGASGYSGCGSCAHSPESGETNDAKLNCVLKGQAVWYLWACLAGWNPSGENRDPAFQPIGDRQVEWDQLLTFTVSATDLDSGDSLTYSATPVPNGASFDIVSGLFSWTPAISDEGDHNITFSVTDDGTPQGSDQETVTISVVEPGSIHDPNDENDSSSNGCFLDNLSIVKTEN
jgi:hypothetical protein